MSDAHTNLLDGGGYLSYKFIILLLMLCASLSFHIHDFDVYQQVTKYSTWFFYLPLTAFLRCSEVS